MAATGLTKTVPQEPSCPLEADCTAAILAIGTANPTNCVRQDEFADWYFRTTKSQHLTMLQAKAKKICEKSGIQKRYLHHVEEMMHGHRETLDRALPSLGTRLSIAADAVPELAATAAARAIAEWGRPAADITHLVVGTSSGAQSPGLDLRLAMILGLKPAVQRTLLYFHACSAGAAALRVAKDLAENNAGARVLVSCVEVFLVSLRAPEEANFGDLVCSTLWGDGAGAVMVGAGPTSSVERPIFHMVCSAQVMLPGTDNAVVVQLSELGLDVNVAAELPALVGNSIEQCLTDVLAPLGLAGGRDGWNGFFWAAHPGGRAILDSYEAALRLKPGKLAASRHVLSEYGNMAGASIIFVLEDIRRRGEGAGDVKESEHCEWGVLLGLGPGMTVETMVLRRPN